MENAPIFSDLADGPDPGAAYWLKAEDGVRIRVGLWGAEAARGTLLLFPGRTEYIEKYGRAARLFAQHGLATLAVDWRGQGIADRLLAEPAVGHVEVFTDYQKDVRAVVEAARALDLPRPWYLLGHSMGGCIGLRALHEGLPVEAACFTGPMWGIRMSAAARPFAWAISSLGSWTGQGHRFAPGTTPEGYIANAPFEDNLLTRDAEMWAFMQDHLTAQPDLLLGGPSLRWLGQALRECRALDRMASPATPAITFLGTNERIVDVPRIHSRMARWPNGRLELIEGGEHEVLMDSAEVQRHIVETAMAFFREHTQARAAAAE